MKRPVIISIILILAAVGGFTGVSLLNKSKKPTAKHYNKLTIERTVGCQLKENERELEKIPCKSYHVETSDVGDVLNYIDFYVFDNEASANYVFFKCGRKWFQDGSEYGDNYVRGWLAGVCDAEIESYLYITGNMIIVADLQCVSCWAEEPPYEVGSSVKENILKRPSPDEIVFYITSNF